MPLTGNTDWRVKDPHRILTKAMIVADGAKIWNGALVMQPASGGEVLPYDGTETEVVLGWHLGDAVEGNAPGGNRVRARVCSGGFIAMAVPVAGLADDATDYGKKVYALDDGAYTLTAAGNRLVGRVIADDDRVAGQANVLFFDMDTEHPTV